MSTVLAQHVHACLDLCLRAEHATPIRADQPRHQRHVTTGRVLSGCNVTAPGCFVECHRAPAPRSPPLILPSPPRSRSTDRPRRSMNPPKSDAVADLFARLENLNSVHRVIFDRNNAADLASSIAVSQVISTATPRAQLYTMIANRRCRRSRRKCDDLAWCRCSIGRRCGQQPIRTDLARMQPKCCDGVKVVQPITTGILAPSSSTAISATRRRSVSV